MSLPQPPFRFPPAPSTNGLGHPDPAAFFSDDLRSSPLPTNSFFQNFVVKKGDQPEYIHPYLVSSSGSSLNLCFPDIIATSTEAYAKFVPDLTLSYISENNQQKQLTHRVSSFSDLSVTLDFPSSNFRFFLVRGSPYLTCSTTSGLQISSLHGIDKCYPTDTSLKKHAITLHNQQKWLLYSPSPVHLYCPSPSTTIITPRGFSGIIRIAVLTDSSPSHESTLDRFSSCYPVSGEAVITKPFCVKYNWETKGEGDLLMLAHPLHRRLLSLHNCSVTVSDHFKYPSLDGELVGVVGDSWVLKTNPIPVTWHSIKGIKQESHPQIHEALGNDVKSMMRDYRPENNFLGGDHKSKYFYLPGRWIARAARLALIAEEVSCDSVTTEIKNFLKTKLEPWLDGTINDTGFQYEGKWGGIVNKRSRFDYFKWRGEFYKASHIHMGYFVYAISVLAKMDTEWGIKYRPQAYSLLEDYMNFDRVGVGSSYPRLRCFDMWMLHSWDSKLGEGRYQENISEAVNAYYSAALMGLAFKDSRLFDFGSTLTAMEILSAQTWCHVKEEDTIYPAPFTKATRILGRLWSTKRTTGFLIVDDNKVNCSLHNHVLPLLPITKVLFSDVSYVKKLVNWITPRLETVVGWPSIRGLDQIVDTLKEIYEEEVSSDMIRTSKETDDGNSTTNILWWAHSRGHNDDDSIMPSPSSSHSNLIRTSRETDDGNSSHDDDFIVPSPSDSNLGNVCQQFTLKELEEATDRFSDCLGGGGFGLVYKGMLSNKKYVAVKKLYKVDRRENGFEAEVNSISSIQHDHLVSLVGYCKYDYESFLVYEFIPNKSLYDHLHSKDGSIMAWENRVKVAIGVACGIAYLHNGRNQTIIHRDIKPANILLEKDFTPKVADFGLAKLVPNDKEHVTTLARGTLIYMDPEYQRTKQLTCKSDVYSFGVVLLELITGRHPWSQDNGDSCSLVIWARPFLKQALNNNIIPKLVDLKLGTNFVESEMLGMIKIAAACVNSLGLMRPHMHEVVRDLAGMRGEPNEVDPQELV